MAAPHESPATLVLVLRRPIERAEISGLCALVRVLVEGSDADLVVCDVRALIDPDVTTVDALARIQLTARRLGHRIRLRDVGHRLQDLLELAGLSDLVPGFVRSTLEPERQAEQREQMGRIEEEADPGDPAV